MVPRNLKPDARLFLESKNMRLSGDMLAALEGFQKFDTDFQKSTLRPAVQSVRCETLGATGRYADQWSLARSIVFVRGSVAPDPIAMAQFLRTGSTWSVVVSIDTDRDTHQLRGIPIAVAPLKSDGKVSACLMALGGNDPESRPAPAPGKMKAKTPK